MPFTAKENVYVDTMGEGGKVVPGDSAEAGFLLVAKGGTLTDADAERYGLTGKQSGDLVEAAEDAPERDVAAEHAELHAGEPGAAPVADAPVKPSAPAPARARAADRESKG